MMSLASVVKSNTDNFICQRCKLTFQYVERRTHNRKYCNDCKEQIRKESNNKPRPSRQVGKRYQKNCEYCEDSFIAIRFNTRFCSQQCAVRCSRNKPTNCCICNKDIRKINRQKYCSRDCVLIQFYRKKLDELEKKKCVV